MPTKLNLVKSIPGFGASCAIWPANESGRFYSCRGKIWPHRHINTVLYRQLLL